MVIQDKPLLLEVVLEHYGIDVPSSRKKVCCPVHDESRPSAVIDPITGSWKCFACQESGDAYDLIQFKEKVGFADAVRIAEEIFDRSEHDLPSELGGQSSRGVSTRSRNRSGSRRYKPSWIR